MSNRSTVPFGQGRGVTAETPDRAAEREPSGTLGERAVRGVVALGVREGGMKLVSFTGDIALYRLLVPADFGVVVPIAFLAGIIKQFTDVGLHPSVIQRKENPSRADLRAVFTVHLGLVTVATAIVVFAGPPMLTDWVGVDADPWMIRVFGISIWLSAFRLVPAALLERHLRFGRLAAADIAGTVWYFSAGIGFAIGAFEAWSLIIAHVGASIVSTLAVLVAWPWAPIPSWRPAGLRHYLRFGAQFQGARLALMAKDSLIPLLSPRTIGVDGTGLLSWADKISSQPLTLTQLVSRVTLPTFSRMQDDLGRVRRGAELTLKWNGIVTLPAFAAVIAFAPEIAVYIYGEQWLPAIPALYALAASAILVPINGLLTPILAALGRTRVILVIAIVWAVAAWALAIGLSAADLGILAIPISLAATQFAAALVLLPLARDVFDFRLLRHLARPLAAAVLAGAFGRLVLLPLLTDWVLLIQGGIVVVLLYAGLVYLMDRETIRREVGLLFRRREPDPGNGP